MDIEDRPLSEAAYAPLSHSLISPEAHSFVNAVIDALATHEVRKRQRSAANETAWQMTVGVTSADLIWNARTDRHRWSRHAMRPDAFTEEKVGYRNFVKLIRLLAELEYIEVRKGTNLVYRGFGPNAQNRYEPGYTTRFRATPRLLDLAAEYGVTPQSAEEHFRPNLPAVEIVKRASSVRSGRDKTRGRTMKLDKAPKVDRLRQQVRRLNEFLSEFELDGAIFPGYRRIFNEADITGFDYDRGGRLTCPGSGSYLTMKEQDRLKVTISDAPVVEIDINASFLTIYAALKGYQFAPDQDPYNVPRLDRAYVKAWVTATLGWTKFHRRWPDEAGKQLRKAGLEVPSRKYTMSKVQEQILEAMPFLKDWPDSPIRWSNLMFIESQAIIGTMVEMMHWHKAPALSTYDGILVRESDMQIAVATLMDQFKLHVGVYPRLKVSRPSGQEEIISPLDRQRFPLDRRSKVNTESLQSPQAAI